MDELLGDSVNVVLDSIAHPEFGNAVEMEDKNDAETVVGSELGLSCKLQGLTLDVIQGCEMIKLITSLLANARSDKPDQALLCVETTMKVEQPPKNRVKAMRDLGPLAKCDNLNIFSLVYRLKGLARQRYDTNHLPTIAKDCKSDDAVKVI
ncbi:hypothetical protein EMCRGX_G002918 [Ephydatia muelleri]